MNDGAFIGYLLGMHLRKKKEEKKQQEQATFRQAAAKIPQQESYEEFRARKLAEQEVGEKKP